MKSIYQGTVAALAVMMLMVTFAQGEAPAAKVTPTKTIQGSWGSGPQVQKIKKLKKVKKASKAAPVVVEKETWICPMCRIKAEKAGKCPECGMDMVKLPKEDKKK